MHVRPFILLAIILVSPVARAIGGPSFDGRVTATARSLLGDFAQLEAPIGHRQPTLDQKRAPQT
jgi:hypothetical protein